MMNFSGYILAGGQSSRMKTDKAFLEIGGETFIARAIKALNDTCQNQVKIVLNRTQTSFIERLPENISHIFDKFKNRGALGGIHAALTDCETKYALILAVDLPFVTPEVIAKLAEITVSSNKFTAAVPRQTDGRLQPLCAAYSARCCLPALENLLQATDSASVRDFLEIILPRVVDQSRLTSDQSNDIFYNVNHPAEFEAIK